MKPTVWVLRHLAFEDLGDFAPVLAARGHPLRRLDAGVDRLDAVHPRREDLVFVLGGPIGADEERLYPCLRDTLGLLQRALAADAAVFGICLGAQLLARALGAEIRRGTAEIGLLPLQLSDAGRSSCLSPFAADPLALHWHGDCFDLPPGAERLASTPDCPNQAFSMGPRRIGCQFHPEGFGDGLERWLIGHTVELRDRNIDIPRLRQQAQEAAPSLRTKAAAVLQQWLEGVDAG